MNIFTIRCTEQQPKINRTVVQFGTNLNHQELRNMTQFSTAFVMEGVYCLFYCNIFYFNY